MATVINAQTSAGGLSITPDLSGQIALQSNGTTIATVTPTGITTQVGAPAFSVTNNGTAQSVSNATWTKVSLNTKDFDTNSNFDATTNYRFQPTVAGYYHLDAAVRFDSGIGTGERMIVIYKNGAEYKRGFNAKGSAAVGDSWFQMEINVQVYANGTGDYFEIYMMHGAGANRSLTAARAFTRFQGCMIRGA